MEGSSQTACIELGKETLSQRVSRLGTNLYNLITIQHDKFWPWQVDCPAWHGTCQFVLLGALLTIYDIKTFSYQSNCFQQLMIFFFISDLSHVPLLCIEKINAPDLERETSFAVVVITVINFAICWDRTCLGACVAWYIVNLCGFVELNLTVGNCYKCTACASSNGDTRRRHEQYCQPILQF